MKRLIAFSLMAFLLMGTTMDVQAQWIESLGKKAAGRAKEKARQKVEDKVDETVDKTVNGAFDAAGNAVKGESKTQDANGKTQEEADMPVQETPAVPATTQKSVKLESVTQYDFVPGDQVLLFEDFSQDAIGDFPALWTTNGSGEVKTLNLAPGNWLNISTGQRVFQLMKDLTLPDNFIIEFDLIVSEESEDDTNAQWSYLRLFRSESSDLGLVEDCPSCTDNSFELSHYTGEDWYVKFEPAEGDNVTGSSTIAPMAFDKVEHLILWIQKRRVRLYHDGKKAIDMPTLLGTAFKPNRISFEGDHYGRTYLTNLRITTAAPDTRSKLITEGKLISYGIYFDVNSDRVKPESNGALGDIARVIREAGGVKVQVVGHTDATGDDARNLDLSRRRAASVKAELVKLGVSADLLTTDGAGETKPIAPNDTPSNMALNRRVEFIKQ